MIKFFTKRMNNKKGFTLIELIVVIAILGILAAIAIPRFTGMRHEATLKSEASTAASIISAVRVQEAETGFAAGGTSAANIVNESITAAAQPNLGTKFMTLKTPGTNIPQYQIHKSGEFYVITWVTKAGGSYSGATQTLTEAEEFVPAP